jgi:hypothetical protein
MVISAVSNPQWRVDRSPVTLLKYPFIAFSNHGTTIDRTLEMDTQFKKG